MSTPKKQISERIRLSILVPYMAWNFYILVMSLRFHLVKYTTHSWPDLISLLGTYMTQAVTPISAGWSSNVCALETLVISRVWSLLSCWHSQEEGEERRTLLVWDDYKLFLTHRRRQPIYDVWRWVNFPSSSSQVWKWTGQSRLQRKLKQGGQTFTVHVRTRFEYVYSTVCDHMQMLLNGNLMC